MGLVLVWTILKLMCSHCHLAAYRSSCRSTGPIQVFYGSSNEVTRLEVKLRREIGLGDLKLIFVEVKIAWNDKIKGTSKLKQSCPCDNPLENCLIKFQVKI